VGLVIGYFSVTVAAAAVPVRERELGLFRLFDIPQPRASFYLENKVVR
jgi:hypothetical protein